MREVAAAETDGDREQVQVGVAEAVNTPVCQRKYRDEKEIKRKTKELHLLYFCE